MQQNEVARVNDRRSATIRASKLNKDAPAGQHYVVVALSGGMYAVRMVGTGSPEVKRPLRVSERDFHALAGKAHPRRKRSRTL